MKCVIKYLAPNVGQNVQNELIENPSELYEIFNIIQCQGINLQHVTHWINKITKYFPHCPSVGAKNSRKNLAKDDTTHPVWTIIQHSLFVMLLSLLYDMNSHLRTQHIVQTVGAEDQTTKTCCVYRDDRTIGIRRYDEFVHFGIVRPQIS